MGRSHCAYPRVWAPHRTQCVNSPLQCEEFFNTKRYISTRQAIQCHQITLNTGISKQACVRDMPKIKASVQSNAMLQ